MIDFLLKQLERINKWLLFSETKNATLIAFNIAICSVLSNVYDKHQCVVLVILFGVFCASLISLISFFPNDSSYGKNFKNNEKLFLGNLNLTFWGDIIQVGDALQYIKDLQSKYAIYPKGNESKALLLDLANEIIINSHIIKKKCKLFKRALIVEIITFIVMIVMLFIA